jgi:dihydrofolate reductase
MRRLLVTTFLTLDGVMQAPGGPGEDDDAGFPFGGWSVEYWDDTLDEVMGATMGKPFAMLLGRKSYEILSAYWPTAPEEEGGAELNAATKYVASRGAPELTWQNSVLLQGDAAETVAALKQEDGPELQVHGSANLIQTLMRAGLVDAYQLITFPVLVGTGKRLFGDGTAPSGLKLVDTVVSKKGVVVGRYEPAGELVLGSFS